MKIIIATHNRGKFTEICDKLKDIDSLEFLPLFGFAEHPEIEEDRDTFEGNAVKKAVETASYYGMAALADDSGLAVDALDGRPGVYSARYGGPGLDDRGRNKRLLDELRGVNNRERSAKFICVIALGLPDGTSHTASGECRGFIAEQESGGFGFGYDPVFFLPEFGKTMAELPLEIKNGISHRSRALDAAREMLERLAGGSPI